ncbi:MAG: ParB/RepB/Spo0J family partition protein [Chloroflexi bacterium]|nr:ParB/RepB/Spo0J family partition protein [Chloroflexota bacterium]
MTSRSARRRFTVDDLFQDTSPRAEGVTDLEGAKEIRLDRIVPDPDQPRRTITPARFAELVASVRQEGVLVPIEVTYDPERNLYVIVHGERRWRAAREAGLASIPALVRELDTRQRVLHQLIENILREDLNAVDRSRGLRALKDALGGVTWEQVAETVGIRRSRLFQLLDVAKLPETLQEDIRGGRLSEKHGRALKDLPPPQQEELRQLVLGQGLSGDETLRVAQLVRRGHPGLSVEEALTAARAQRSSRPAPPVAASPDTAEPDAAPSRAALPAAAAAPARVVAPSPPGARQDPPTTTVATTAPTPAAAATPGSAAAPPPAPGIGDLEASRRTLAALLADLAARPLSARERQHTLALLRELRDLVDTALAHLGQQPADADEPPRFPQPLAFPQGEQGRA